MESCRKKRQADSRIWLPACGSQQVSGSGYSVPKVSTVMEAIF